MAAISLLAGSIVTYAQLSPDEALRSFQLADDVRIELVADEPLVASPCALAFDERGRLFVAENRGYPNTAIPPKGTIALLEDTDGDGRMDKRTVFADELTFPNGVLPWHGGVIVTCAPDVLYLKDTDGDGRADERRVLLTGFDTKGSTQLRMNAPTLGPDGWIYLAAGLAGGTITCPDHPERAPLKMTADVRFHPDTLVVENVDGRSQYGMSFDDFGRRFICMNRLPVQHVVLSSKWLARNPRLAFSETVQDCNERSVKTDLKGGGDGVKLFPISSNITTADSHAGSFSAACGVHIWRSGALPMRYDGAAFSCDPTGNLIHVDQLEPHGATFSAVPMLEGHEFLASRDDWFRPVFLARGPDGALYLADMVRKVIEHPDYLPEEVRKHTDFESGKEMGRIWRITGKAAKVQARELADFHNEIVESLKPATDLASTTQLADDPNPRVRFCLALVLGDSRADYALPLLAKLAVRDADDRWMRAVVLSGIAGREAAFLHAVLPKIVSQNEGELELLGALGRCFENADALQEALGNAKPSPALAAIWVGFLERNASARRALLATPAFAGLLDLATQQVGQASSPSVHRLVFTRLLAISTWDIASKPLLAAFSIPASDDLRTAFVKSLAALDGNRAASALLVADAWPSYSPTIREALLAALLSRPAQLDGVLTAIESGALPISALTSQRRQVFEKHKDAAIRDRAVKLFAATASSPAAAQAKVQAALALKPKSEHGREVFKQLCATCHRLEREGVAVGPDLFDVRRQTKEMIAFHIIAPDAEIVPAFTAYSCETKDGRSFAGILTSETSTSVTLRKPGGAEEAVLRADVKSLVALPGSLMPPGLDAAMQPQDLADLLAFLKGEK